MVSSLKTQKFKMWSHSNERGYRATFQMALYQPSVAIGCSGIHFITAVSNWVFFFFPFIVRTCSNRWHIPMCNSWFVSLPHTFPLSRMYTVTQVSDQLSTTIAPCWSWALIFLNSLSCLVPGLFAKNGRWRKIRKPRRKPLSLGDRQTRQPWRPLHQLPLCRPREARHPKVLGFTTCPVFPAIPVFWTEIIDDCFLKPASIEHPAPAVFVQTLISVLNLLFLE